MATVFETKTQQPSPAQRSFHHRAVAVSEHATGASQNSFLMSREVAFTVLYALTAGLVPLTLASDFSAHAAAILTVGLSLAAAVSLLNFNRPDPQLRAKSLRL